MLRLVEDKREKERLQRRLRSALRTDWPNREKRTLVWRPSSIQLQIQHNGKYWFAAQAPTSDQKIKRYWNSVGIYSKKGDLVIALEVNIPTLADSRSVSGFFAIDETTNVPILMHDGAVGGGRPGVGKSAFLRWSGAELVEVYNSQGDVRLGLIVARLEGGKCGEALGRFVQTVLDFKNAVAAGQGDTLLDDETRAEYKEYFDEHSGRKKAIRSQEIDYISRHGDVVRALKSRRAAAAAPGERTVKNVYIDLGVVDSNGDLIELYEVKTSLARQNLYAGIGQLIVHSDGSRGSTTRYLVVPGGKIPRDVTRALRSHKIKVLRFALRKSGIVIT